MRPIQQANGHIIAYCPYCQARTTYSPVGGRIISNQVDSIGATQFKVAYAFNTCVACGQGGVATLWNANKGGDLVLVDFFPFDGETAPLPKALPDDIRSEFREAEKCASFSAYRAASAMYRSTLEKALIDTGYDSGKLIGKINQASSDGVITGTRAQRAHDEVRDLGNDVLHDPWREVTEDEVKSTAWYTQRILEDLYDDREAVLKKLNRNKPETKE